MPASKVLSESSRALAALLPAVEGLEDGSDIRDLIDRASFDTAVMPTGVEALRSHARQFLPFSRLRDERLPSFETAPGQNASKTGFDGKSWKYSDQVMC